MPNYLPPWMAQYAQSSAFTPQSPYLGAQSMYQDPAITQGMMQPNIYAPSSNPYSQATPLSSGVSGLASLLQNAQFLQGIAALGGKMSQGAKGSQAPIAPAPVAPVFNGAQFTPRF